jgi:hypothetical protein
MKSDILSILSLTGAISFSLLVFSPIISFLSAKDSHYIGPMVYVYCFYADLICNVLVLKITQSCGRDKFIRRVRLIAWIGILFPIFINLIFILWNIVAQYKNQ